MQMQFDGAVIKEGNVTFAIAVVKPSALASSDIESLRKDFSRVFQNIPVVFMAQNAQGTPRYSGRRDLVNFISRVPLSRIPWKKYNINFYY